MPTILPDPTRPDPPQPDPENMKEVGPVQIARRLPAGPDTTAHDASSEDFANQVEAAMHNHGDNWKARVVLTKIPNVQRRVIELIYLEHLSLTRTAERLGVPVDTVKSRCLEGIGRLREGLGVAQERLS